MAEMYPFKPDWCLVALSETLKDWLSENGMSGRVLSVACGGRRHSPAALTLITEVLEREPLTQVHADCLARGTFVPARMWLNLEHNYRAGLAAGLTDASEDAGEVPGELCGCRCKNPKGKCGCCDESLADWYASMEDES